MAVYAYSSLGSVKGKVTVQKGGRDVRLAKGENAKVGINRQYSLMKHCDNKKQNDEAQSAKPKPKARGVQYDIITHHRKKHPSKIPGWQ